MSIMMENLYDNTQRYIVENKLVLSNIQISYISKLSDKRQIKLLTVYKKYLEEREQFRNDAKDVMMDACPTYPEDLLGLISRYI